jgi:hypothetical protein
VLARDARLAVFGIIAGVLGSLLTSRLLTALLYGVGSHDPLTMIAVVAILGLVTLGASLSPAIAPLASTR